MTPSKHKTKKGRVRSVKGKKLYAVLGRWYLLSDGCFNHFCCNCGSEHRVEVGIAWKECFEKVPTGKIAIRFLAPSSPLTHENNKPR